MISLNKSGQRLMESQNGNICVSFSNVFAVNFSINIMSLLPSNITIPDVGMYVRIKYHELWGSSIVLIH